MNFGNLLVAKGLVSASDISEAIRHQTENGGRLGDSIVALGLLTKEEIDEVLADAPQVPTMLQTTGLDPVFLLELAMKGMYAENIETASQMAQAMKLSSTVVNQILQAAKERKLVESLAAASGGTRAEMRLSLTRAGREWACRSAQTRTVFWPGPCALSRTTKNAYFASGSPTRSSPASVWTRPSRAWSFQIASSAALALRSTPATPS